MGEDQHADVYEEELCCEEDGDKAVDVGIRSSGFRLPVQARAAPGNQGPLISAPTVGKSRPSSSITYWPSSSSCLIGISMAGMEICSSLSC